MCTVFSCKAKARLCELAKAFKKVHVAGSLNIIPNSILSCVTLLFWRRTRMDEFYDRFMALLFCPSVHGGERGGRGGEGVWMGKGRTGTTEPTERGRGLINAIGKAKVADRRITDGIHGCFQGLCVTSSKFYVRKLRRQQEYCLNFSVYQTQCKIGK